MVEQNPNTYQFTLTPEDTEDIYDLWRITCADQEDRVLGRLVFGGLQYNYCLEVQDLYVQSEVRRQGIGRALLEQLIQAYPEIPIFTPIIPVYRNTSLEELMHFFRAQGFETKQLTVDAGEAYFGFDALES